MKTLIGGGAGFLLGGPAGAMTGALMLRGMGGGGAAAAGAAGAAGALAGASWGRRFLAVAGGILRSLPKLFLWSIAIEAGLSIIENWRNVSTRLKAIWDDLKQAAPAWAGGQGQGWGAFAQGPAMSQTGRELEGYLTTNERGIQDWLRGTAFGQWLISNGLAMSDQQMARNRLVQDYRGMGIDLPGLEADARMRAVVPDAGRPTVSMGPVTISTTINVAANSTPSAIGDAAGSAVGSALRGVLGDVPATP
jgi:hypothetical protein